MPFTPRLTDLLKRVGRSKDLPTVAEIEQEFESDKTGLADREIQIVIDQIGHRRRKINDGDI